MADSRLDAAALVACGTPLRGAGGGPGLLASRGAGGGSKFVTSPALRGGALGCTGGCGTLAPTRKASAGALVASVTLLRGEMTPGG